MRRFISILLLAVFGLPFLLPMLAMGQAADRRLPACCRRNGAHHCMGSMDEGGTLTSHPPHAQAPGGKCPYCPGTAAPTHPDPQVEPAPSAAIFGNLVSHPAGIAQTEARYRVSRDRSNGKRGPPALTSS